MNIRKNVERTLSLAMIDWTKYTSRQAMLPLVWLEDAMPGMYDMSVHLNAVAMGPVEEYITAHPWRTVLCTAFFDPEYWETLRAMPVSVDAFVKGFEPDEGPGLRAV